jgi:hypothetical protein
MALTTMPKGMEEHTYIERAAPSAEAADENRSSLWNPQSELMPGARDVLRRIVRTANQTLIEALKANPDLMVRVRTPAPNVSTSEYVLFRVLMDRILVVTSDASMQIQLRLFARLELRAWVLYGVAK